MDHLIDSITPALLLLEETIFGMLIVLEVAVLAIFVWRLRSISQAKGDTTKWIKILTQNMKQSGLGITDVDSQDVKTVPGRAVKTALENWGLAPEALEKVFDAQESIEKRGLEAGLSFLGTVGANAPFLGLTGTVIGILVAFDRFAASAGKGSTEVMVAISQALVATAIGLLVAIPAVVFYNILRSRSKMILEESREIQSLILARTLHTTFTHPEA
ncbi:MAG TPA: MotA/TolQ/ExbB proton channel family protein [Bacteroidota bacterium]|nr:MotA/TolQ/ExbB proton channel family protein [Bacteroidota bacterium]